MTRLNYIAHKLLNSKYRFIITIFIYIIITLLNNSNTEVLCLEDKKNNDNSIELSDTFIGSSLFIISILLMLLLQSCTDHTEIITNIPVDAAVQTLENIVTTKPELLDDFSINDVGELFIGELEIEPSNDIYLNSKIAIEEVLKHEMRKVPDAEMRLMNFAQHGLYEPKQYTDLNDKFNTLLTQTNILIEKNHELQETLEKLEQVNNQNVDFVESLREIGVIKQKYFNSFKKFTQEEDQSRGFLSFLRTKK